MFVAPDYLARKCRIARHPAAFSNKPFDGQQDQSLNINDRVSGSASRHEIKQPFGMPTTVPAGSESAKPLLGAHAVSDSLEEMALIEI